MAFPGVTSTTAVSVQFQRTLHSMGFLKVRVLYLPNNFGRDWISRGFPVEKGQ